MKIKSIKTGKRELKPKAFLAILFTLFLIGVLLGAAVAAKEDSLDTNILVLMPMFSIPIFLILYKPIKNGVIKNEE